MFTLFDSVDSAVDAIASDPPDKLSVRLPPVYGSVSDRNSNAGLLIRILEMVCDHYNVAYRNPRIEVVSVSNFKRSHLVADKIIG